MPRTDHGTRPARVRAADLRAQAAPAPVPPALRLATLAGLAVATFAAFAGVLRNGWLIWDDPAYVVGVPDICRGLSLHGVLRFLHEPLGANWLPLTACSHMLDVQVFALAPAGHHATSLLLHALNALALVLVLHRMTGAWWRSVLVGAFFALHPLRVESVAWISERKDVLSGLFFLLTLGAYTRWVEHPGKLRFALVVTALALGLMSKSMLVTVPFVLVVLDVWAFGRLAPRRAAARSAARPGAAAGNAPSDRAGTRTLAGLVGEKWPLLAMSAAAAFITYIVQAGIGATQGTQAIPFGRRLCNVLITYWRYIGLTAWPRHLVAFHPFAADANGAGAVLAGVALVATTAAVLVLARRSPWLALGWFWYVGMLVPVIGIVQVGSQAYADRYTYLPGIGLAIAAVWVFTDGLGRSRAGRSAGAIAALAALTACGLATARQVSVWRDTTTLFTPVLTAADANRVSVNLAHKNIGWTLLQQGRVAEAAPHLEAELGLARGCEDSLRRVLWARPGDLETRRTLAATLARETRVEEAIRGYDTLLVRSPDDVDALNNIAWIRATHVQAAHRDARVAVRCAERARDLCPEPVAVVYSTLAAAYAEAGRFPDATRAAARAIQLARATGQFEDAKRFEQQLALYRAGQPWHFDS